MWTFLGVIIAKSLVALLAMIVGPSLSYHTSLSHLMMVTTSSPYKVIFRIIFK